MPVRSHFILFVQDQAASRRFYGEVLRVSPSLDVPGMTEFPLSEGAVLGLMPVAGVRRLLGSALPGLPDLSAAPRTEVYLQVEDPAACHLRALAAGGREVGPLSLRSWGHEAAYSLDPDGHLLAFARPADAAGPGRA